jgi:hypothetical protein
MSTTFPENRAVYEIMLKNMVQPEWTQITIWRHIACWISKATAHVRTHGPTTTHKRMRAHTQVCNIYCFSTAKMVS